MLNKEFICLNCTLPICDEKSDRCLYQIEGVKRRSYMANYYKANREKKIAAAKARNRSDRAGYAAYFRAYRKRKAMEKRAS